MKDYGYIFILTLCITAVMSLLVLSGMHQVLLYQQVVNKQKQQHQRFYQLERSARTLIETSKTCKREQNLANKVILQVLENKGCALNTGDVNYQYIVEDLGVYPCLVTKEEKATHHFRLTLIAHFGEEPVASLVQIRVIKRAEEAPQCKSNPRFVTTGISSWRYFSDLKQGA